MVTWTIRKAAQVLGVDADRDVRPALRMEHPHEPHYAHWRLDRLDLRAVAEWNIERGNMTEAQMQSALEEFDRAHRATPPTAAAAPEPAAHPTGTPPDFRTAPDESAVCDVAAQLFAVARSGGSLFTDHDVWTDENIDALVADFVKQPDVSGADFFAKLDKQLRLATDDVRILFAELLLLQMLPLSNISRSKKVSNLERALAGVEVEHAIPARVLDAFDSPVLHGGVAFGTRRFYQICALIEFVRYMRSVPSAAQDAAFSEPLEWRKLVQGAPGASEPSLRASLLFLGHPGFFFPIVSVRHKRAIVRAFFPAVTGCRASGDLDADLTVLRDWLSSEPGVRPDFYSDPLESYWREGERAGGAEEEALETIIDDASYTVDSIIDEGAFHSPRSLRSIITRWDETRNIVLQGAPGTGKTWLARRLAYALIGRREDAAIRSVQFHPGTSYEDFVRGWRPSADGTLALVDGPLLQHAQRAAEHPDIPHVILIEEFNRGNPAQALGEMLTLLERSKRNEDDGLELTYTREGEGKFSLPENLYLIGTMNTADRSLALVDFALRRRFAFFELEPQFNDAWRALLASRFPGEAPSRIQEVSRRIMALNERIAADPGLGAAFKIGHSYFTPEKEASEFEPWFRTVVESSVLPQLAEYWHDDREAVEQLADLLLAEL